ncbi:MAG: glycosyltransferase family 2 protein [Myxococcota bacterium]
MWLVPTALYWSSAAVVAYTYAGYPLLVYGLSRLRGKATRAGLPAPGQLPAVSVVMAAHNEQARIGDKLDNLLDLDYPAERLDIIVVSDGSSDRTDAIVADYAERHPGRITLERVATPSGKPTALNRGVARARGELILFCDVRQTVDRAALRALVEQFSDSDVGAASGELHMPSGRGPGVYWKYEKFIRAAESRLDSLVGATGALYAIRRALFRELPADCLLDDVFTPMQIALRGYRVVLVSDAAMYDIEASTSGEFARKARTLAGNYQLLRQLPQVLSPRKNRLLFQLASHKLARLICPFALTTLFASNVVLVATGAPGWPLYVATLAGQLGLYSMALRGARAGDKAGKLAKVSHTFVVLNAAAVEGLRRFLTGNTAWTSARTTGPGDPRPETQTAADPSPSPA